MAHILIVDDERDLAELLELHLRASGFSTAVAPTGEAALSAAREQRPDLVLLDLMLPDASGTEVCRALRASTATRDVPVVMLTARSGEGERVLGFEVGADDYVTKPFSVRELMLRVKALLRRAGPTDAGATPLTLGPLVLERATHRFLVAGQEVALTALEFRLVEYLLSRVGRVQTRAALLEDVWGLSSSLETRTIDTHVLRLREKLGSARACLETVRGVGYRMVPPPGA